MEEDPAFAPPGEELKRLFAYAALAQPIHLLAVGIERTRTAAWRRIRNASTPTTATCCQIGAGGAARR
jgi:hypothetical protein